MRRRKFEVSRVLDLTTPPATSGITKPSVSVRRMASVFVVPPYPTNESPASQFVVCSILMTDLRESDTCMYSEGEGGISGVLGVYWGCTRGVLEVY